MPKISKKSPITLVELPATQFGVYNGNPSFDIYSGFGLPSRSIHNLEGILRDDGWENVKSVNPIHHGKKGRLTEENQKRIYNSKVLCISSITRTSPQSMTLGRNFKTVNSEGIVIAGGPDPTFRTEEWLEQGGVDIVVRGEGEKTFYELMGTLKDGKDIGSVDGIGFKDGEDILLTDPRKLLAFDRLSQVPHPFYDSRVREKVSIVSIETSRGCPNACNFCSVTKFYGRKYRTKPIDYVIEELKQVKDMGKFVFFSDDNFAGKPNRTINLLEAIADNGLNRWSSAQVTVKAAENPKLLGALKKAGVRALYVGVESIIDETLNSLGKPYSAKQNKENIKKLREEGFWVHGMMIVGGDGDTPEKLRETSEWINKNLDSAQLFPPTPLPGTDLHNKMKEEGRILTYDSSLYDCQSVVTRPMNFTPYELQMAINKMYERFYSPKEMWRRLKRSSHPKLDLGIFMFVYFLGGRNILYSTQAKNHLEFLKAVS